MNPSEPALDDLAKVDAALADRPPPRAPQREAPAGRLEGLGYALRARSEEAITEILKPPPTRPPHSVTLHKAGVVKS